MEEVNENPTEGKNATLQMGHWSDWHCQSFIIFTKVKQRDKHKNSLWLIWACHRDETEYGDRRNRQVNGQYLQGMKAGDWTAKQEVTLKSH